jgi:monoamine oxidase
MSKPAATFDTVVLGAGAAGLAAAAELAGHERSICVLEARDRLGGRIFTRHEAGLAAPIELGAEFIHGMAPATIAWLKRSNTPVIDASRVRWTGRGGKLEPADNVFEEMKRGLDRVRRPRKDLPFSEFLDGPARGKLSVRAREFARTLVQGFDAADATRVSTLKTLDEWNSQGAADAPTFRPLGGYSTLISALAGALDPAKVQVQLNTVVHEVRWRRGAVTINATRQGEPFSIEASQAIIALPLGVLQLPAQAAGAVRFTPPLSAKQKAFDGLAVGPVIKVLLRFRTPFWEALDDGRYRDTAFLLIPGAAFPTFWSTLPLRTPLLNAWAAGPNAVRLSGLNESEIVRAALDSLESAFGRRVKLRPQLQGAFLHDWQADPFSCGAYSYVMAGGASARKQLAVPLQKTLFFAGEAADTEGESGTVAGALQSGQRAARQVLGNR